MLPRQNGGCISEFDSVFDLFRSPSNVMGISKNVHVVPGLPNNPKGLVAFPV
jgi:hypothetical protein